MKKMWFTLLLFLATTPLFAGVVFEVETTEAGSSKVETSQAKIEGQVMAIDVGGKADRDTTVIFRGDRRELVVVDHGEKSFMVINKEMMEGVTSQLQGAMKQLEAQLGNLPPEQAAKLKEMMGGAMPESKPVERPKNEMRKTSEEADIEGYPCVRYDVLRDGEKIRELWVTPWSRVPGGKETFAIFEDLGDLARDLMGPFQDMASKSVGNSFFGDDNPFEDWQELTGFPVLIKMVDHGKVTQEARVKSIQERKIDTSELEPNPGYSQRQMPGPR